MFPVCIPTYKHPKVEFIDRLINNKEYVDKKFQHPLYYFIYDIDWDTFDYNKYSSKFQDLHFVKVPFDQYRTAMRMRLFIKNYMTDNKFDFFFMFDNDVAINARGYDYENHKMVDIDLDSFLNIWENLPGVDQFAITRPCVFWMGIKHDVKPQREFKFCKNPVQTILINNKLMNENGVNYTGDIEVAEDMEIAVNCLIKGLTVGEMYNYFLGTVQTMGNGQAAWYNLENLVQRTWEKLKHTGYLTLKKDRKGNLKLACNKKDMSKILFPSESEVNLWD